MLRITLGTLALAGATLAGAQSLPVSEIVKRPPSWSDEFTTGLNPNDWDRGFSPWPNTIGNRILPATGERQVYVDWDYLGTEMLMTQKHFNSGGTALFLARRMDQPTKNRVAAKVASEGAGDVYAQAIRKADWSSAMIKGSANRGSTFQYGYIEASILWIPTAESWPAFWLLPQKWGWPPEIDIVEMRVENGVPMAVMGIHSKQPGWVNNNCRVPIPNYGYGYHRYGFHWNATTATFYLDGKVSCVMKVPPDLRQAFYPIVNLAMGGWGATPTAATKDTHLIQVDYVRIWKGY